MRALERGRGDRLRSDVATAIALAPADDRVAPPSPVAALVPAAVLVPLIAHDDHLTVLLTQRTAHLAHHAGQISFPGGRMESADGSAESAALRESREEIGLAAERVDLLGRLDDYVTVTGFHVVPVVGLLRPPLELAPDPHEVAEIFEVPLAFVMDAANHQRRSRLTDQGVRRWYYAIEYRDRVIWGATAAMLVNLYEVLAGLWNS